MNDTTLVICLYNQDRYIVETLQHVVNQTFQQFDILIIDDASTDESLLRTTTYLCSVDRDYQVVTFEKNRGLAACREYAWRNVETKYLIFVDADDLPQPTLVERLHAKITSDGDLMAVGCYNDFIDSQSRRIWGGIYLGATTKEKFYERAKREKLIFMQPTAIVDREVVLRVKGDGIHGFPDCRPRYEDCCEDLELWSRMSDLWVYGKAIVVIAEVLVLYRKHSGGISASAVRMNLRIKHIKINLKRRRAGEKELTFTDFLLSLTDEDMQHIERNSQNGDRLRRSVIMISSGRILKGGYLLMRSIVANPHYFWQKLRSNTRVMRW